MKAAPAGGWPDNSPLPRQLDAQCQRHHSPSYGDLGEGGGAVKLPFHETGTTLLSAVTEKEHCLVSQQYVSLLHSCISKSL